MDDAERDNKVIIIAGDIDIKMCSEDYFKNVNTILQLLSENCRYLIYIPGDSDVEGLTITGQNIINIDKSNFVVEIGDIKVGLLGLGGAPTHSVREKKYFSYLWNENIPIVISNTIIKYICFVIK